MDSSRFAWLLLAAGAQAHAQGGDSDAELAKKLANPVAALISVPYQMNYDEKIGPARDGERWQMNFQPVVPFDFGSEWTIISRTIVPLVAQQDIFPGAGSQSGLGDITQSLFFAPKHTSVEGFTWAVGPAFLLPAATDELLGTDKWGGGPTGIVLMQKGPWTYGALVNHLWSFEGHHDRPDFSSTFLQPFLSYRTTKLWTYVVNAESSYDWKNDAWSVPINLSASKLVALGKHRVSFFGGVRYWTESPESGAHDWGLRFGATLLYPK
ncbi:MAG TPA: transporter [Gammaproteobacteria bacterium]|nr:transporter [Gammaproteobacteria bacterium]